MRPSTKNYVRHRATIWRGRLLSPFIRRNLTVLAKAFGTDKWGRHAYTIPYERHLAPYRGQPIRLLEIGIGGHKARRIGGASLRMWKAYFPRAHIFGLDIYDKTPLAEARITILQGDQGDADFMRSIGRDHGPFDIIIDDGSHENRHVITSFEALFPSLAMGGMYVIEDTQTSFWPRLGGDPVDTDNPSTSMAFMKGLVDSLNWQERGAAVASPSRYDLEISALHFYHNMVFVEKGGNTEPGGDPQDAD